MGRDVPYDKDAICDNCGKVGAFDFMGDYLCEICSSPADNSIKRVNNKVKQVCTKDYETGVHTKDIETVEKHNRQNRRKKKKVKKTFRCSHHYCPFCGEELKVDKNHKWYRENTRISGIEFFWNPREKFCRKCGAMEYSEACPACKKDVWIDKDRNCKHIMMGCGFVGKINLGDYVRIGGLNEREDNK